MAVAPSSGPQRGPRLITLLGLLGLGVALRLFAWSRTLMMMNDGVDFLWQAERLLAGDLAGALSHPYHPLYGALAAAASLLTGELATAGLLVSIVGGSLVILAAWGLARTVLPDEPRAPAAAGLVAATCARVLHVSSDVQSDGLFAGLCLTALWAAVAAAHHGGCRRRLAAAGLCTGLAYLTRPEGLYLVAPVALWVAAALAKPARLLPRLARSLAFALTLLLAVVPYVVTLHELTGVWGLSLKPSLQFAGLRGGEVIHDAPPGSPLAAGFIPRSPTWRQENLKSHRTLEREAKAAAREADEPPPKPPLRRGSVLGPTTWSGLLAAAQQPVEETDAAIRITLAQFVRTVRLELWLLLIPGLVALFRRRPATAVGLVVLVLGWLAVSAFQVGVNGYLTNRHLLVAVTMLLPVAGLGLVAFCARGRWLSLLAVLALVEGAEAGTRTRRPDNGPRLEALAWITENTSPDQAFLTHRRRDGYYADRTAVPTRMPCDETLLAERVERDAIPYLVYDLEKLEDFHPDWIERGVVREVVRFEGEGDTVLVLELEPRFR